MCFLGEGFNGYCTISRDQDILDKTKAMMNSTIKIEADVNSVCINFLIFPSLYQL